MPKFRKFLPAVRSLTAKQLSAALGVSLRTAYNWQTGARLPAPYMQTSAINQINALPAVGEKTQS